jgi:hypothetical protein
MDVPWGKVRHIKLELTTDEETFEGIRAKILDSMPIAPNTPTFEIIRRGEFEQAEV